MKKSFVRVAASILVMSMLMSMSAFAADKRTQPLDFAANSQTRSDAQQGWEWDAETKTLTLINAQIDTAEDAVLLPAGATVVVSGSNTVKSEKTCITASGDLTIKGSGSIALVGDIGIRGEGNITADIESLNVTAVNIGILSNKHDISISVNSALSVTVTSPDGAGAVSATYGKISLKAGAVDIASTSTECAGIYAKEDITIASDSVSISSGGVNNEIESASGTAKLSGAIVKGCTLRIKSNILIPENTRLVNNGVIICTKVGGKITCEGRLTNNGTISPDVEYAQSSDVYVNGVNILQAENMTVACGSGKAEYDSKTGVLTLTDAVISSTFERSGIYAEGIIDIAVNGECSISGGDYGINAQSGLLVAGGGSLKISNVKYGIFGKGITTLGCRMDITAQEAAVVVCTEESDALTAAQGYLAEEMSVKTAQYSGSNYFTFAKGDFTVGTGGVTGAEKNVKIVSSMKLDFQDKKLPAANVGTKIQDYDISSCVSNGAGEYRFTAEGLPEGLTISQSGVISGTPSEICPEGSVKITVEDKLGNKTEGKLPFGGAVNSAVKNGKASIIIAAAQDGENTGEFTVSDELIKAAKEFAGTYTECSLTITAKSDTASITVNGQTLKDLGSKTDVTVKASGIELHLDNEQVSAIEKNSSTKVITFKLSKLDRTALTASEKSNMGTSYDVSYIYEAKVLIGSEEINNFTGVSVKAEINIGESGDIADYIIRDLANGSNIRYEYSDGEFEINLSSFGRFAVLYESADSWVNVYDDIKPIDWYYGDVRYVTMHGLMNGVGTGFAPNKTASRAMFVTVLYRYCGSPAVTDANPFEDVSEKEWYYDAVRWAYANGYVKGASDTKFAPTEEITREQMVTILYRFSDKNGIDVSEKADLKAFADNEKVNSYALDAVKWAAAKEIINGSPLNGKTYINPGSSAKRCQMAAIIRRFIENT